MNNIETPATPSAKVLKASTTSHKTVHSSSPTNSKSGKLVANQIPKPLRGSGNKLSPLFWASRVFKAKNDRAEESPNYSMKVQFKGRRFSFTLRTTSKDLASRLAAGIYNDLLILGVDATLAKHRPEEQKGEAVATIGEYIAAAKGVVDVRPASFAGYAANLRRIAGDILNKHRSRRSKIALKNATKAEIDKASLEILTPTAVQAWRLAFVARVGRNAKLARSARISSNSFLRNAKSLFSPRVVKFLATLRLPNPLPFTGVEMFPRESMRYHSKIDAGEIMRKGRAELAESKPEIFHVLLLAIACGLRRGEIDLLSWGDIDFKERKIHIDFSEHGDLKTEDSRGAVDMDGTTAQLLQGYRAKLKAKAEDFVIPAYKAAAGDMSREWGNRYRTGTTFEKACAWLRENGVDSNKPIHTLRKEAGSIIATRDGIFAASTFLRHSDISVTAKYYADKKTKTTIDMASLLAQPEAEPAPDNVLELNPVKPVAKTKTRRTA
jgi:integrase